MVDFLAHPTTNYGILVEFAVFFCLLERHEG